MTTIIVGPTEMSMEELKRLFPGAVEFVSGSPSETYGGMTADKFILDELGPDPIQSAEPPRDNRAQWKREKNRHRRSW